MKAPGAGGAPTEAFLVCPLETRQAGIGVMLKL